MIQFRLSLYLSLALIINFSWCSVILAASSFNEDHIPVEFVTEIIGGDIFPGLPENFPLPVVPLLRDTPIDLIGSNTREFDQSVYIRSHHDVRKTLLALRDGYVSNGWMDTTFTRVLIPSSDYPGADSSNNVDGSLEEGEESPVLSTHYSLCQDQVGMMTINVNSNSPRVDGIVIRYIKNNPDVSGYLSCEEQKVNATQNILSPNIHQFFRSHIPDIIFPENAVDGAANKRVSLLDEGKYQGSSSGYSLANRVTSTWNKAIIIPDYSVDLLLEEFVSQIQEQGWTLSNNLNADGSSLSLLSKIIPEDEIPEMLSEGVGDLELTGLLTLVDQGEGRYDIWLRMVSR